MKTGTYITLGILLLIVILLVAFRKKLTALFTKGEVSSLTPAQQAAAVQTAANNAQTQQPGITINRDKYLYKGVTAPEVKLLQDLLGVTSDGIFGPQTEAALQNQKCVVATTLNAFAAQSCNTNLNGDYEVDEYDSNGFVITNPVTWF